MKIVIYGARGVPAKWSGFDTFITQLAPRLVEKGHTVVAFCQPKYTDAEYHKAYKGVRIIMLPTIYGKFTETVIHEILSSIYSLFMRDIDIMYVLGCRTVWAYLPHKLLGRTIVINTDGQDGVRRKWGPISRLYLRFNYWLARQMSDYLISDAKELKNYYLEHHNKETAFLTNGGFIVADLDEGILAEYDLIQNGYYLVACRMEPENNIDIIIREFEQTDVDAKLVIAGGANYKSRYYQSLKQTSDPRIVFLGPVYTSNHIETLHLHARGYLHGHEVGGTNPSLFKA
ncbi:MAG: DUF1972 domain-containing protein, partial [Candidatus Marinimicrobia bacterium]|nr:DUF1972 domain-containing protein [Candidatus Neomarinimicrobiota bacterium]